MEGTNILSIILKKYGKNIVKIFRMGIMGRATLSDCEGKTSLCMVVGCEELKRGSMSISDEEMREIIAIFEKEIKAYEDTIFGLMLYHQTSPKWAKALQKTSYKNMKRRGEKALKEARIILSDAKQGKPAKYDIPFFEFPIILDDMKFRIELMLQCYEELYPERPHDRSLSKEEIIALRNKAMNKI